MMNDRTPSDDGAPDENVSVDETPIENTRKQHGPPSSTVPDGGSHENPAVPDPKDRENPPPRQQY